MTQPPRNGRHAGFSLLEVLVALLVLSIGLLGLAGLHVNSVSNVRDAYFRSQALMLSYDIADRMRANLESVESVVPGDYDANAGSEVAACRTAAGCTAAQLADDDVFLWRAAVAGTLPNGDAIVCLDSSPNDGTNAASAACDGLGDQYVAKIWWDSDRDPDTAPQLLTTVFVP